MVFGGFVNGYRVDELLRFKPGTVNLECEQVAGGSTAVKGPKPRTAHVSGFYNNHFYVYGGQDDDNNKLGDLWDFDCTTKTWKEIPLADDPSNGPCPRSGHSCIVNGSKMYIFGGIFELTKELNDLLIYDFATGRTHCSGMESPHSPDKKSHGIGHEEREAHSPARRNPQGSPAKKRANNPYVGSPYSPKKRGHSPSKTMTEGDPSATAKGGEQAKGKEKDGLSSPTSISMASSFIIKNADQSFDAYYQSMKKRKAQGGLANTVHEGAQQTH